MNLIGKEVTIKTGWYKGEWGIVRDYDGEYYYVALWNGNDVLIFSRQDIKVSRSK